MRHVQVDKKITVQKSGGQRFGLQARYDSISPIALRRLAETHYEGDFVYGRYNWRKGLPISDTLNHCIKHLFEYLAGDKKEDHLSHALWGVAAAMHYEETFADDPNICDIAPLKVKDGDKIRQLPGHTDDIAENRERFAKAKSGVYEERKRQKGESSR